MAVQLQLRSGTTTEHNTFTGANGEVTVDTTNKTLRVHDGSTVGGTRLATLAGGLVPVSQLPDATTSVKGIVILNNTLASTSTTQALTANMGNYLNDKFNNQTFGIGQTWQDMTTSRVIDTVYTNSDTKPIFVVVVGSTNNGSIVATVGGSVLPSQNIGNSLVVNIGTWFIVPPATTYKVSGVTLTAWSEMKI